MVKFLMIGAVLLSGDARIFLNGVAVDGIRNQEFKNATVRVDAQGVIHIDAPGYSVAPPAERLTLQPIRLFGDSDLLLIIESGAPGQTGVRVEVLLGGKVIVKEDDPVQAVHGLRQYLASGENKIEIRIAKDVGSGDVNLVIGLGQLAGNEIKLTTDPLVQGPVKLPKHGLRTYQLTVKN